MFFALDSRNPSSAGLRKDGYLDWSLSGVNANGAKVLQAPYGGAADKIPYVDTVLKRPSSPGNNVAQIPGTAGYRSLRIPAAENFNV